MDHELDDRIPSRGAIGLLAAGFAHGLVVLVQLGMGLLFLGVLAADSNGPDPVAILVSLGCSMVTPAIGLIVACALFVGARVQRDEPGSPVVVLVLAAGVFWPVAMMGLSMLCCNPCSLPMYLFPAFVSLAAAALVSAEGPKPRP